MRKIILILILFFTDRTFAQKECDTLFKLANKAYQEQGAKQAIVIFNKIIELQCGNLSSAYNNRGFMYNEVEDYKKAINDFQNAIKIDSTNHAAYANESTSYNLLDNHYMAIIQIEKAIKLEPTNYQYYRLRGDIKYSEQEYDSAITDYKKSIELEPSNLKLYTLIAKIYEEKIRNALNKANSSQNTKAANTDSVGQVLSNFVYSNRDSAEAILTMLINRFPENKLLIYNRAEFFRRNFLYDNAIPDYIQGLKDNGSDYEHLCNLGFCYDGNGDYQNAIKYYTLSLSTKPNVLAYVNRGRRYKKLNKLREAIADEESAIRLDSTYAQSYLILGNCYLDQKQNAKALECYKKGLAQNPKGEIKELLEIQLSNLQ